MARAVADPWSDFCDALARAGEVVQRGPASERAEGYRYLTRLARLAFESFVEGADPRAPVLRRPAHETAKLGADNPDNVYWAAAVSGLYEYRLWGMRGEAPYLGIGTYAGDYGGGRRGQTGYLSLGDAKGEFEVRLSCAPQPGLWLPMESDTASLIVRETFTDRRRQRPAELRLERVGGNAPGPLDSEVALARAAAWLRGTADLFAAWTDSCARRPNELPPLDPAVAAAAHGDPNIVYYHGYWILAPDEELWIEVTPPACDYWNFQLDNHWMESLDYRWHRIALNGSQAVPEADRSLRIVVAHADPGHPNWIETAGHARGTMCLRWVGAREHPTPRVQVRKRSV